MTFDRGYAAAEKSRISARADRQKIIKEENRMKRKITALFMIVVNSLTCRTARCPKGADGN